MNATFIAKREAAARTAVMIADAFQICGATHVTYTRDRVHATTTDGIHLTIKITAQRNQP